MSRPLVFWASQVLGVLVSILAFTWAIKHRGGFAWREDPGRQFSWHPVFMIVGMVYLLAHGIVIFRIFPDLKKWPLKMIHMGVNLMAGSFAGFALLAVIDERNALGKRHFQSLHSWIGVGALFLYAVQWVAGFLLYLLPCASNNHKAKTIAWHGRLGKSILILATIAAVTGIKSMAGSKPSEETTLLNIMGIFIIISLLYHLFILSKESYKYGFIPTLNQRSPQRL